MPRTRPPYPPEFRSEAIELVRSAGKSVVEVARDLGVSEQTLHNWLHQADLDAGRRHDGLTSAEREELNRLRRENPGVAARAGHPTKSERLLRTGDRLEPIAVFEFVDVERAHFPITRLCRLLGVSPSGYYAWRTRPPSEHAVADARLSRQIRAVYDYSRCTYGAPRVHAELQAEGVRTSRKRVARLMRQAGLVGCHRRRHIRTTQRTAPQPTTADLVQRDFSATAPDRLWVADITYIPTWTGFLFLAVVLDVFSRRVVGWAMASHLRTELVLAALNMAIARRRPRPGLIHHSDHGCQYTSLAFGRRLQEAGIASSIGSRGDCYDNALCESFFATLECELLDRQSFPSQRAARLAVFDFIEGFYNTHRRHSALAYLAPAEFERRCQPTSMSYSYPQLEQSSVSLPEPLPRRTTVDIIA